jgi:hypothetical protein
LLRWIVILKIRNVALFLYFGFFSGFAITGQNVDAKPFVISYVIYPDLEDYLQLIEDIYTELGFVVTMLPTPANRGLVLLNEGEVDADLLREKNVANKYPNILLVEPPLNNAELILLCVIGVPCQRNVLLDKNEYILTGEGVKQEFLPGEFLAKQISVPTVSSVKSMLTANRISYAIYAIDMAMGKRILQQFHYAVLKDLSIYHLINQKHAALLPLIEAKLREKLPAFIASRNL